MMSRAEIYERNAAECERECARATTSVLKRKYRDVAQQWRDMAEQADQPETADVAGPPQAAAVEEHCH
jgi:hypothetical protein